MDIGGTFTDLVVLDDAGTTYFGKALTTHDDPSRGVFAGLEQALALAGQPPSAAASIIHGTTLVTNALIERKGAKTALVTTQGFRDTLEFGTESRYDLFDLALERPEPLVPRELRFTVDERVLVTGEVLRPLDEARVREVGTELRRAGVEAVAVCLLHSYRNPAHERRILEMLRDLVPEARVCISSDVSPAIREYQRASTTVANVYVQGMVERYLRLLDGGLRRTGFDGSFLVMLSSGGTCTTDTAARYPIGLLESGPVGGAVAAAFCSREHRLGGLLVFDMGGTTAKISLLDRGVPPVVNEFEVARAHRFKKGSGIPISIPVIDMIEIGAGGGSIARVDRLGRLKVGPDSAGSSPGPACYVLGGKEPTVTDANLVLGYLNPDFFLGGKMRIDPQAAREAVQERIAGPLGLGVLEAAWGIVQIETENMASAARVHAAERGRDLRSYSLFAFGGAGPVHACHFASALGVGRVIVPAGAGVLSAFGFLTVPLSFQFTRTLRGAVRSFVWPSVNAMLAGMEAEGMRLLEDSGVPREQVQIARTCEARYLGQSHEIGIMAPGGELGPQHGAELERRFAERYRELYQYEEGSGGALPIEVLNWHVRVAGPAPAVAAGAARRNHKGAPLKGTRDVYVPEARAMRAVPVYDRYCLDPGAQIEGPAIIEEHESTLVLTSRFRASVDEFANLMVERHGEGK